MKDEKAKQIILENLKLGKQKNIPIIQWLNKQENLIKQFIHLGYTREQFFEFSRNIVFNSENLRT